MHVEEYQRARLYYPEDFPFRNELSEDEDWIMLSEGTTGSTWEKKIGEANFKYKEKQK